MRISQWLYINISLVSSPLSTPTGYTTVHTYMHTHTCVHTHARTHARREREREREILNCSPFKSLCASLAVAFGCWVPSKRQKRIIVIYRDQIDSLHIQHSVSIFWAMSSRLSSLRIIDSKVINLSFTRSGDTLLTDLMWESTKPRRFPTLR